VPLDMNNYHDTSVATMDVFLGVFKHTLTVSTLDSSTFQQVLNQGDSYLECYSMATALCAAPKRLVFSTLCPTYRLLSGAFACLSPLQPTSS
jgi:hypothetical protein